MPTPRVLILFNEPTLPVDHPDSDSEHDILYTADGIARILQQAGILVERLGIQADPTVLWKGLQASKPDAVFNLYEGLAKWGDTEAFVSGLLELSKVSFTGSPTQPLLLCRSKPLTKQLLKGAGLPTADFMTFDSGPVPICPLPWPVIVKPGEEDASVGIEQASVCRTQEELEARVAYLRQNYGPSILVERFIRGREFNVAVIERNGIPETLPFSEIFFVPPTDKPDLWPIVSFSAKWHPGTVDFTATPVVNPAVVDPELHERVRTLALQAFHLLGCRDYARVDFRVDETGQPYILEVNPNPCISPLAGLAAGLESAKIPYADFIIGLVKQALSRSPRPELIADIGTIQPEPSVVPHVSKTRSNGELRPGKRADILAITRFVSNVDWATKIASILEVKESHARRCYVLEDELSEVVAVAIVEVTDSQHGVAVWEYVSVSAEHRQRGHARQLLTKLEASLAQEGVRLLLAHTSSSPAEASVRQFLQRLDWRTIGEWTEYYRDGYSRLTYGKPIAASTMPTTTPVTAMT
ncbi:MAG: GNAT family N-acetyltransferase [Fimbriiglobus sp.]